MPEGDTIHRSAARLRQLLPGAKIVEAQDNGRFVASDCLVESEFASVEARGKHLLMHLADGRVIHSHMGMTGSWHVYDQGEPWRKSSRWAALTLSVRDNVASTDSVVVCFSPKTLELLTATQLRRHRHLQRLGPDLMSDGLDEQTILGRFRVHNITPIGEAVMNQTIVCGIGNVYKSETLFLTGSDPFQPVSAYTDEEIVLVARTAQELMHKNRIGYPRQTRLSSDGERMWVYGRAGQDCFRCGEPVAMKRQGDLGRSTYWCPKCQGSTTSQNRP